MTAETTERRRTPLAAKLVARIGQAGPITVADYMRACLHDPEHGYYRVQAGIGRDFVTAPEISQMFGELIGLWCAVVWRQMGKPDPVRLIELGPGRGTMMRDMLNAMRRTPDFLSAVRVTLVETGDALALQQRALLQGAPAAINWSNELPEPAAASIIVANEFLDTMPARQYVRTATGWTERTVAVDAHGLLQFACDAPAGSSAARILATRFPIGEVHDIAEIADRTIADWLAAQAGPYPMVALFIDYGHTRSAPGDTLQAVRQHRYEHPLCSPGEADLTLQVDFGALCQRLQEAPALACDGPVTQAEFLGALGLIERASRLMAANPDKALAIETAAQRLLAPDGMGTRFKVIAARSRSIPPLPGLDPGQTSAC